MIVLQGKSTDGSFFSALLHSVILAHRSRGYFLVFNHFVLLSEYPPIAFNESQITYSEWAKLEELFKQETNFITASSHNKAVTRSF